MKYSKNYNKAWYDKAMQNPEFRAKRVKESTRYRQGKMRERYAEALQLIGTLYNADIPMEEAVDKLMEKYKVNERK